MCTKEKIVDHYRKSGAQKRLETWCMFRDLRATFDELDKDATAGKELFSSLFPQGARNANGCASARFFSLGRRSFGR